MTIPAAELTPCLCGCGNMVRGDWKRGHARRGVGGYDPERHSGGLTALLLPTPEEADAGDFADFPGPPPEVDVMDWDQPGEDVPEAEPEEIPLAPPPAPIPKSRGKGKSKTPPRLTAATRADIEAKFGLMLTIPGTVWRARDPVCGGAFMESEPNIRQAGLELILQSPDLISWFTGVGGGFMLYLNLLTALQPVLFTIWAHHIAHSIETPGEEQQPARQYAA
jgi:hypothetical protein